MSNEFIKEFSKNQAKDYNKYYYKIIKELSKIDFSLGEKLKNALSENQEVLDVTIKRLSNNNKIEFPNIVQAGEIFAEFRNGIAHGNPSEIEPVHCVLFEVARALIYIMILKNAGMQEENIKTIIHKMF